MIWLDVASGNVSPVTNIDINIHEDDNIQLKLIPWNNLNLSNLINAVLIYNNLNKHIHIQKVQYKHKDKCCSTLITHLTIQALNCAGLLHKFAPSRDSTSFVTHVKYRSCKNGKHTQHTHTHTPSLWYIQISISMQLLYTNKWSNRSKWGTMWCGWHFKPSLTVLFVCVCLVGVHVC